jgi:hypothetical protein
VGTGPAERRLLHREPPPDLLSSTAIRRGPHDGCFRRASNTAASTCAGICCGDDNGRCDPSTRPSNPDASYLASQA